MRRLSNGDTFPSLQLPLVGDMTLSLPDDLAGDFGVVLICRGAWCRYCNAQLAAFSRAKEYLDAAGIKVVAFSVDDESTTAGLVETLRLTFPVAHSMDAAKADWCPTRSSPLELRCRPRLLTTNLNA